MIRTDSPSFRIQNEKNEVLGPSRVRKKTGYEVNLWDRGGMGRGSAQGKLARAPEGREVTRSNPLIEKSRKENGRKEKGDKGGVGYPVTKKRVSKE